MTWHQLPEQVREEFLDAQALILDQCLGVYAARRELDLRRFARGQAAYARRNPHKIKAKNAEYYQSARERLNERRRARLADPAARAAHNEAQRRRAAARKAG